MSLRDLLSAAERAGDAAGAARLLRAASAREVRADGENYLRWAAETGNLEMLETLTEHCRAVEPWAREFTKALQIAAKRGDTDFALAILKLNRRMWCAEADNHQALRNAITGGHRELARALIRRSNLAGIHVLWPMLLDTPEDNTDVVEALLVHGAPMESLRTPENRPLSWACHHGHEKIVRMFLDAGLALQDVRAGGNCAIACAAGKGSVPIVRMLLDKGLTAADLRADDCFALLGAAWRGHEDIVDMLLAAGPLDDRDIDTALAALERSKPERGDGAWHEARAAAARTLLASRKRPTP